MKRNRNQNARDEIRREEQAESPRVESSGDLLSMMASGFNSANPTLQAAVPEAEGDAVQENIRESTKRLAEQQARADETAPRTVDAPAPGEELDSMQERDRRPRKAIVSVKGRDVEEIEIEGDKPRAA